LIGYADDINSVGRTTAVSSECEERIERAKAAGLYSRVK
jgi:hypothetical protein